MKWIIFLSLIMGDGDTLTECHCLRRSIMSKLLVVETSPRGEASVSRRMTRAFVEEWRAAHGDGEVILRDLAETDLPFITANWLEAYFTPPPQLTPALKARLQLSDTLTGELLAADHLVISTPVYNFNIPAALKAWVDHIVRKGVTLGFDGQGLVHGKKATVILASGGIYSEGSPIRDRDIATQYLRLILSYIGITDVSFIAGGGAKAVDLKETTMENFVNRLLPEIQTAAA
ncbi:MAG: FMN-dependent NADH-azoreductase [Aestuariivirga sp.]